MRVWLVLQDGRPMHEATNLSDKKIWALYFASHRPTLYKSLTLARNAIRRQKRMEKKKNVSLGYLSTMCIEVFASTREGKTPC